MKILELLTRLSRLLLPAFVEFRPFVQMPSQSLDHPERIMEQRGQINCLDHNFHDLDILRRFEAPLFNYPEVRVGCETLSLKPFRPSSQPPPEPEDRWAWTRKNNKKEVLPRKPQDLEDSVVKYFVIDMYGNETAVGPGSEVTVETYDLSQVYASENDFWNAPNLSDLSKRPETFKFEQLCFPSLCYRPGEKLPDDFRNDMEWFTPVDGGSFLECESVSGAQCNFMIGHTADFRRNSKGKLVGSVFSSNITTYCSLETNDGDGPLLGPLRTPIYSGLPDLLSSSSSLRSQVSSDLFLNPEERDLLQGNFRTSTLFSSHYRADEYEDEVFITSCYVTVPLEAPLNTSFAVDFFVAESQYAVGKPIRPGQQMALTAYRTEEYIHEKYGSTSFRTHKVPLQVKFEDLCFPVECFQEPPPGDEAKCELVKPRVKRVTPPGAVFMYVDAARKVNKLLWPMKGYYNKFTL